MRLLFIIVLFILPYFIFSQNIVLEVNGKITQQGRIIMKGNNLADSSHLIFLNSISQVKLLTPKGICVVRYKDFLANSKGELKELVRSSLRINFVGENNYRNFSENSSKEVQIHIIDSLCKKLKASPDNIENIFNNYVTPYCVSEFKEPYWKEIGNFLIEKYGLKLYENTGELMSNDVFSQIPKLANIRTIDFLPASFSLKKYCPIPGNQGSMGTCTGWASAYGARTISWAIKNNITNPIDVSRNAFSPSFVYEQIKFPNDYDCSQGAPIASAARVLKERGAVFLSDLRYACNLDYSPFLFWAKDYAIKDFYALTNRNWININQEEFNEALNRIKFALFEKKPILASIRAFGSFGGTTWNGLMNYDRGNHAVCIIGYNDNFSNGEGAVEIINSWGPTWGNSGFIYVKYSDLKNILNSAIALYDDISPLPAPKPIEIPANKLNGSVRLILKNGVEMPLENKNIIGQDKEMNYYSKNTYTSGTMFRIYFTSEAPAYVYVVSSDNKGSELTQLFPNPQYNISALLDFNSQIEVAIPNENYFIELDENAGEDHLCIIYSKNEIDISKIKEKLLNNTTYTLMKAVKEILGNEIIDDRDMFFDKNKVSFKANSKLKSVIPIFISIKHN